MNRSAPAGFSRSSDSSGLVVPGAEENHRILGFGLREKSSSYGISMIDINKVLASGAIPPEARVVDQPRIEAAVREILLSGRIPTAMA